MAIWLPYQGRSSSLNRLHSAVARRVQMLDHHYVSVIKVGHNHTGIDAQRLHLDFYIHWILLVLQSLMHWMNFKIILACLTVCKKDNTANFGNLSYCRVRDSEEKRHKKEIRSSWNTQMYLKENCGSSLSSVWRCVEARQREYTYMYGYFG